MRLAVLAGHVGLVAGSAIGVTMIVRTVALVAWRWIVVLGLVAAAFLSVGAVVSGATADVLAQPGAFGQFPGALIQVLGLVVALVAGVAALCCARAPR